jgi:agmatine deiminase
MTANAKYSGKTPRELGYRMPAEWEKHDAIWLSWPYDPTTFPSRVDKAEEIYVQIVKQIHQSEHVNLLVKDKNMKQKATHMFRKEDIDLNKVCFFQFDYADVWFRDYGPTFVVNAKRELAMVHWIFNSWGEKYDELLKDNQIAPCINQKIRLRCFEPGIVLEGGSIDVNGQGTVLTTEQCLLNKNRNPNLRREEIEAYLKNYLGVSHIVWLKKGIVGDDTDGHVDDLARFVNPSTVVCAYEEDKDDENYAVLKENYEFLLKSVDQEGKKLNIVKLPMPGIVGNAEKRLPASYANFYIGNEVVLVPIFEHDNDKSALSIIQEQFPDRRAVGVNCVNLVYGLGSIHCITQQQPSAKPKGTTVPKG